MNIFKEGKKVSLRNIVKKDLGDEGAMESDSNAIDFPSEMNVVKIMTRYVNDHFMSEFYQFLCGTGQFDLCEIKPEMWKDILRQTELVLPDGFKSLHVNSELG